MQIPRIRLPEPSRLRPRHVAPKPAQAHEPEVSVKVRGWINPARASPDLCLKRNNRRNRTAVYLSSARCA